VVGQTHWALGAQWLLVGDSDMRTISESRVADPRSGRGLRSTVATDVSHTSEERRPIDFLAEAVPVMTPTVAAVLARIVRTLRDHQEHEAA
jgi:hypothetical protein